MVITNKLLLQCVSNMMTLILIRNSLKMTLFPTTYDLNMDLYKYDLVRYTTFFINTNSNDSLENLTRGTNTCDSHAVNNGISSRLFRTFVRVDFLGLFQESTF